MRVLICDDEGEIRDMYRMAFEAEGAEVAEAVDGDDCLAQAGERCPDLIVLDLFMPGRDGLATLPDLKRQCPSCPVLVVTAYAASESFKRSKARGATACFDKLGFTSRIPRLVERYGGAA